MLGGGELARLREATTVEPGRRKQGNRARLGAVWVGMSRIWTLKELDDMHSLPEGWTWADDPSVGWHARYPGGYTVCIDASDDVVALHDGTRHFEPPARVALAVILASKGLDSLAAMADELDRLRVVELDRIAPLAAKGRHERAYHADGHATGLHKAAAMLRRGTIEVQP